MRMQLTLAATLSVAVFSVGASRLTADEAGGRPVTRQVEMFAAIQAKEIAVKVIPRDAKLLNIMVENKTDKPLNVKLPVVFVAAPVLAQFNFPPIGNQPPNQQNQSNQTIGGNGNQNNGPGGPFQGIFSVPPGKVIKGKLTTVCLEFGKPTPRPKIAYEIRPLESHTSDPVVRQLLTSVGSGKYNATTLQLAVWHVASGTSWQEIAGVKRLVSRGKYTPVYSKRQIDAAKKLVEKLPESQPSESTAGKISQR